MRLGRVLVSDVRDMACILEVRNLSVAYVSETGETSSVIVNVGFDIGPGEILGVLGESGSGKSTLAVSILRLLPANGRVQVGTIRFEGRDVLLLDRRELESIRGSRIAMIDQEPSAVLHPTMRIRDQLGEILRRHERLPRRLRLERTRQILAELFPTESERIADSYPHELSGGQRQRVLIAQAIACRPSLIVADEPTVSLDATTEREILAVLLSLRQKFGLAILLITHSPALVAGVADRVLVLYAGRVVEVGPTASVLASPLHPYTGALLKCLPQPLGPTYGGKRKTKLPVITGDSPSLISLSHGCRFEPRCPDRFETCRQREPPALSVGNGRTVACFCFGG
jgi:oligopeptide/dipeptide ABC transporter ATP-binding protein